VKSLERITFCHIHDVYQLLEMLWTPEMKRYQLVIIDSLATLFLPIRGDAFNDCMYIKMTYHQLIKPSSAENIWGMDTLRLNPTLCFCLYCSHQFTEQSGQ
jgi:hypothetical protein